MDVGTICDVKRFAIHDGPGIRTTFFLKGCSLRCLWCHNPESIRRAPELAVKRHKCVSCGACTRICSCHRDGCFDRVKCIGCGRCVDSCLWEALILYGRRMTVSEALKAALEDRVFYEDSGGGVTLSGGEPLLQAGFCAELFAALRGEGIPTALDTCGEAPWEAFETLLPVTDLVLYDFKHCDDGKHRELTGRGNGRIRENLLRLGDRGFPVEIRMPLLPGINMDEDTLKSSAEFLSGVESVIAIRLLPYHSLARGKYEAIGLTDTMPHIEPPDKAALGRAAGILEKSGHLVLLPDS